MSRERADVQEAAAPARGEEPERVLVALPVVLEIPGLPRGQLAAPERLHLAGDLVEVEGRGLVGGAGPEGHEGLR